MISNSHGLPFEIRHCCKIGEGHRLRQEAKSTKFILSSIEYLEEDLINIKDLPIDLEVNGLYTISCWDTNYIVEGVSDKTIRVIEQYGTKFIIGREYLLISPIY